MHRVHNESVSAVSQVASRHHHDMKTSLLDRGDTRRLTPAAAGGMVLPGLLTMAGCTAGAPDSGFFGDGSRADRALKGLPSNWEGPRSGSSQPSPGRRLGERHVFELPASVNGRPVTVTVQYRDRAVHGVRDGVRSPTRIVHHANWGARVAEGSTGGQPAWSVRPRKCDGDRGTPTEAS